MSSSSSSASSGTHHKDKRSSLGKDGSKDSHKKGFVFKPVEQDVFLCKQLLFVLPSPFSLPPFWGAHCILKGDMMGKGVSLFFFGFSERKKERKKEKATWPQKEKKRKEKDEINYEINFEI